MNWRLLFRCWYQVLFGRPHPYRHPPLLLFPFMAWAAFRGALLALVNGLCLRLDELLYPRWRDVEPIDPLFIIGVQRSGTTLALRLTSSLKDEFSSFVVWELFFAPSIVQKKFFLLVGRLDERLGSPLYRLWMRIEAMQGKRHEGYHPTGLFQPEEDELIFFRRCESAFLLFRYPFREVLGPFARYDQEIPPDMRRRQMEHYRDLVKRHLYVFGAHKRFVAKCPAFTPKIRSLDSVFPGARFMVMVRDPRECVPSTLGFIAHLWSLSGVNPMAPGLVADTLWVMDEWYRYPVEVFADWPEKRFAFCRYPDLVDHPVEELRSIFEGLDIGLSPELETRLRESMGKERKYRSRNRHDPAAFGLTMAEIEERYAWVMERWDFPPPAPAANERPRKAE